MNLTAAAVLAASAALAAGSRSKSDRVALEPQKEVSVVLNNGEITIESSDSAELAYDVEFKPEGGLFFSGPSQKDLDESAATFDQGRGLLNIHAGRRQQAVAKIHVPARQRLSVELVNGMVVIKARGGATQSVVSNGTLEFDAAGLPESACVDARVANGTLSNSRDARCAQPGAVLKVGNGILSVR